MKKLKHCPFCGAGAGMKTTRISGKLRYYVRCENVNCRILPRTPLCVTAAEAEEMWNRREEEEECLQN